MYRALVAVALLLGVGVLPGSGVAVAQADVATFCRVRIDAYAAVIQEDEAAAEAAFVTLRDTAPDEVRTQAATLTDLLEKKGPEAFDTKKGRKAAAAIDEFVASSCGFPVVEVSGIDYEFAGIAETLPAGPTVFQFTNDAPQEDHELILARVEPGEDIPVKKLLGLPEKKADKLATFVGAVFAEPGDSAPLIVNLDPGRYVVGCFIEVGSDTSEDEHGAEDEHGGGGGKPHWKEGMFAEFTAVIVG